MSGNSNRLASHLTAVAAGAALGGVSSWLFAPSLFWAFLLGGALMGGAVRVGYLLFGGR